MSCGIGDSGTSMPNLATFSTILRVDATVYIAICRSARPNRPQTVNCQHSVRLHTNPSKQRQRVTYLILEIQLSYVAPPQTTPHRSKAVQVIASAFSFFDSGCLLPWPLGRSLSRYRINKSPKDLQQPQHVTAWSWQLL